MAKKPGKKQPAPMTDTRQAVMAAVCARVAEGELVKFAAKAEGVSPRTIREWGLEPEMAPLYARARESQAHAMAEQAVEIAEGSDALTELYEAAAEKRIDQMVADDVDEKRVFAVTRELESGVLQRAKLRLDARKWLTSKIAPKLYGERLEVAGEGGGALQVVVRIAREGRRVTCS